MNSDLAWRDGGMDLTGEMGRIQRWKDPRDVPNIQLNGRFGGGRFVGALLALCWQFVSDRVRWVTEPVDLDPFLSCLEFLETVSIPQRLKMKKKKKKSVSRREVIVPERIE